MWLRLMFLLAILMAVPAAWACPVCDSGTGQQVRSGIFDENFGDTLLAVLLPFPILLAIVLVIHFGPPSMMRRGRERKPHVQ